MKILKEGQIDPDFLAKLNKSTNIIMCVQPAESGIVTESEIFPDNFQLRLPRDFNLSSHDVINISTSTLSSVFRVNLKISIPVGIRINFNDFVGDTGQDVFWKIYRSFNSHEVHIEDKLNHHIISDIVCIMYMDTIRMREAGKQMILRKDTAISDFNFNWYIQTKYPMPQIEEIYLIIDNQVYEDFINIF